jgi:hypothetical protein
VVGLPLHDGRDIDHLWLAAQNYTAATETIGLNVGMTILHSELVLIMYLGRARLYRLRKNSIGLRLWAGAAHQRCGKYFALFRGF